MDPAAPAPEILDAEFAVDAVRRCGGQVWYSTGLAVFVEGRVQVVASAEAGEGWIAAWYGVAPCRARPGGWCS